MNWRPEAVRLAAIGVPIVLVAVVGAWLVGRGTPTQSASPAALPTPSGPQAARPRATATAGAPVLVAPDSATITAPGAPVIVVEFLDFECEACGAVYPIIEDLRQKYAGEVTFVARYFPLDGHFNSRRAAAAVESAGRQGKWEEMYQKMFETQPKWGGAGTPLDALFRGYAEELGLAIPRYAADYASQEVADRVQKDVDDGLALGVQGTPTFFINGEKFEPKSVEDFSSTLDDALAADGS